MRARYARAVIPATAVGLAVAAFCGSATGKREDPADLVIQDAAVYTVDAAGSDWPVSSMNPVEGIQVAVTRRAPGVEAGSPWLPGEKLDLEKAIALYTAGGAWACQQNELTGSLERGKAADLVVLSGNLFDLPPEEIHEARALWVLLAGREVYRAPGFDLQ